MLGHAYWFQMIEASIYRFSGSIVGSLWQTLFIAIYVGFGYTSFVPDQPKAKAFLKGLGVYYTGFLLFMMAITIAMAIWVLVMFATNPDALEQIRPSRQTPVR
jgi:hypothetical protein